MQRPSLDWSELKIVHHRSREPSVENKKTSVNINLKNKFDECLQTIDQDEYHLGTTESIPPTKRFTSEEQISFPRLKSGQILDGKIRKTLVSPYLFPAPVDSGRTGNDSGNYLKSQQGIQYDNNAACNLI